MMASGNKPPMTVKNKGERVSCQSRDVDSALTFNHSTVSSTRPSPHYLRL